MVNSGFYYYSHITSERHSFATESDPLQSQSDDTPIPEGNFTSSPSPSCDCKGEETSDENPGDIQLGVYTAIWLLIQPILFDTGGVIYIRSASEYSPVNKNNNDTTVIGYLDSYFEYFYCHDTPITVDPFDEFLGDRGSPFSLVQVPSESTTFQVDLP